MSRRSSNWAPRSAVSRLHRGASAARLRGAQVQFDRITVTGTEDLLMAATLAQGETVIENAAREPEVQDLAALLIKMGAKIEGAGTSTIRVQGVPELHGAEHTIIPDRIEAGTFLIAGAMTQRRLDGPGLRSGASGRADDQDAAGRRGSRRGRAGCAAGPIEQTAEAPTDITTEEYPGFATDLQAQYMAMMTEAEGISFITETIFENRFMHALELARMGANIRLEGRQAIVAGVDAVDRRAGDRLRSARQRVAGAGGAGGARGETVIDRVYHIDRGYEKIEAKLARRGARIQRVN